MLIHALATDYDGTLATRGVVTDATVAALERLKASGRRLVLVTGRELPDLTAAFPQLHLCDAVVAENGALLHWPATGETRALGPPPAPAFVAALKARGVAPLSIGRSIVATLDTQAEAVREAILETRLDWRIILNKESVMCLPPGVNKASGLLVALEALEIAESNVLGVGDAENDHALLRACGVSAAVANALPSLRADADVVTEGAEGAGVTWLIDRLLDGTLLADPAVAR